jgi:hypothetical protein
VPTENESFSSYLKDLKLSKFSGIWTIDKTHNNVLAHELEFIKNSLRAKFTSLERAFECAF